jgi:hypothetical protein
MKGLGAVQNYGAAAARWCAARHGMSARLGRVAGADQLHGGQSGAVGICGAPPRRRKRSIIQEAILWDRYGAAARSSPAGQGLEDQGGVQARQGRSPTSSFFSHPFRLPRGHAARTSTGKCLSSSQRRMGLHPAAAKCGLFRDGLIRH